MTDAMQVMVSVSYFTVIPPSVFASHTEQVSRWSPAPVFWWIVMFTINLKFGDNSRRPETVCDPIVSIHWPTWQNVGVRLVQGINMKIRSNVPLNTFDNSTKAVSCKIHVMGRDKKVSGCIVDLGGIVSSTIKCGAYGLLSSSVRSLLETRELVDFSHQGTNEIMLERRTKRRGGLGMRALLGFGLHNWQRRRNEVHKN